jgi:hypothetical protein
MCVLASVGLIVALAVFTMSWTGDDEGWSWDDGIEIQISPAPLPTPTPLAAAILEDCRPPRDWEYDGFEHQQNAMGAVFSHLLEGNGGRIEGEHFCIFLFEARYYVVLDFQGGSDPVSEVEEWFAEQLEYYPQEQICSIMNRLDIITFGEEARPLTVLCDELGTPEEQREPQEPLEGDGGFA